MNIIKQNLIFRNNTTDKNIFECVFNKNEYNISNLKENDVVVDIGSHIGSFSLKCYELGCRNIFAYEANKENFITCLYNCSNYNINVFNNAVRGNKNIERVNSFPGKNIDLNMRNLGGIAISPGNDIEVITLEDILLKVGGVIDILKLDCEGSEYPIIFESPPEIFKNINAIVGEFHPGSLPINYCENFINSSHILENYLKSLGYTTIFTRNNKEDYGHFTCYKS